MTKGEVSLSCDAVLTGTDVLECVYYLRLHHCAAGIQKSSVGKASH